MEYYKGQGYWSVMSCSTPRKPCTEGRPHVWDGEFCLYGPYKCEVWPEPVKYKPKHAREEK